MVSFASPLFWQINYLVTNLNKKSFKSNVAELNQLVELYGEDARGFLLGCLVDGIDFRDVKNNIHKDALKIQLLAHEIAQASTKPNFTTIISEAIEGSSREARNRSSNSPSRTVSEDFLAQFCRLLKLNLPQQIAVGLALAHSKHPHSAEAITFLRARLPEIATSGVQLSPDVLHSLVFLLKTHEEFVKNPEQTTLYMDSLRVAHPETQFVIELLPLTGEELEAVDMLESFPRDAIASLTIDVVASIAIGDIMEDVGYACTSSTSSFRALIREVIGTSLNEVDVATMLMTLSSTHNSLERNLTAVVPGLSLDETNIPPTWDLDVISRVLREDFPSINYTRVAEALDSPLLKINDVPSLNVLVTAFRKCSNEEFPLKTLFRKWNNIEAQISFLTIAIRAPPDVISFEKSPNRISLFEGADVSCVPKNYSWLSLDLVNTLLLLSESDYSSAVMQLFDAPKSLCPDILIAALAKAEPRWNALRADLFVEIFNLYVRSRPNAPAIIRFLWIADKKLVLHAAAEVYEASSGGSANVLLRLFVLVRGIPQAFMAVLESKYFNFAIAMAIIAANQDGLNLEGWVKERIRSYRLSFVEVCMIYLKLNIEKAIPKHTITPETSATLSVESLGTIIKCLLAAQGLLTSSLVNDLKDVYRQAIQVHTVEAVYHPEAQQTPPPSSSSSAETPSAAIVASVVTEENPMNSEEIEEKANAYFQRIYTSEQSIGEVIEMLKRFKNSDAKRDTSIFACMIHNLFDEYRFFHKYPERELRITGILFGNLIQHQLVTQVTLSLALRYVLDALKKPVNSKMFRFGVFALEQFVSRLSEMPQYCTLLCQIPELRQACPDLMQQVSSLATTGNSGVGGMDMLAAQQSQEGVYTPPQTSSASTPSGAGNFGTSAFSNTSLPQIPQIPSDLGGSFTPFTPSFTPASFTPSVPQIPQVQNVGGGANIQLAAAPAIDKSPTSISVDNIFGDLLPDVTVTPPAEAIQDRIHFIVNNVSLANLDSKVEEMREILSVEHCDWLANYLVVKRISTQPNFHPMYLLLIEKLDQKQLEAEILRKTFQNLKKLLTSHTITTNSQERSLLKNLGLWLGLFTLGRNKPLLQRQIDLKELLYVGYETGHLIAVTPFVAKILDGCKMSKIFCPPNPWVMGLMYVMREIYDVPDLKLNIKFEIEVLCKALKLKVDELQKGDQLSSRQPPPRTSNPDFNVKATPKKAITAPSAGQEKPATDDTKHNSATPSSSTPSGDASAGATGGQFPAGFQETTVIPNLAAYVNINMALALFNQHPNLKRAVPVAVDRAIREIIQPVVERSVTIACITSRELVVKDFATEGDAKKMRNAARLMVANLAGSLALVTCKEPLRVSMGNHLRSLLTNTTAEQQSIEQVVQVCSAENLELGCMLIEKAATEKAMRDIDEALSPAFNARRRHREQSNQPFYDVSVFAPGNRYPAALPEPFRPQPGGLQPQQLLVYESFQRHPRQPIIPSTRGATSTPQVGGKENNSVPSTAGSSPATPTVPPQKAVLEKLISILEYLTQAIARQASSTSGREIVTLSSLPMDSDIVNLLKEIHSVASQAMKTQGCEDALLSFGQILFKRLYDLGRGDQLVLEVLMASLEAIAECTKKLKKEMITWILHVPVEDKLKLHCEILVHLVRTKLIKLGDLDVYLTRGMERNLAMVEFAIHIMRQCSNMDQITVSAELPNTLEALDRFVQRHGATNKQVAGIVKILDQIRGTTSSNVPPAQQSTQTTPNSSSTTTPSSSSSIQEPGLLHTVSNLLDHWINLCKEPSGNEKYAQYLSMLKQCGVLKDEESLMVFLKASTELCVDTCLKVAYTTNPNKGGKVTINYTVIDALCQIFVLLVKYTDPSNTVKLNILNKILSAVSSVMVRAYEGSRSAGVLFDQRVYFRIFLNLVQDLNAPDQHLKAISFQVLSRFASAFNSFQPVVFPGFALAWVELISHRSFMPNLLRASQQRGWPLLHCLLIDLFVFLEPFLRSVTMTNAIRVMYKGTLRILLVLLHDFPEFLCDFHSNFCDVIPPTCIQLRNLILSAFPRNMRLPDPLTPGLQVPLLPEISQTPRLPQNYAAALAHNSIAQDLTTFLNNRQPVSFVLELPSKLLLPANQVQSGGSKYSIPTLNALVLFVGQHAITQLQSRSSTGTADSSAPMDVFQQGPAMDIYQHLVKELDPEGRYLLLSAVANHLRYPNSHTHYFSCLLLFLFSSSNQHAVKEQITRVLLERLIAHRPHPWGLLITFIELIRNKTYKFWENKFLECSSEITMVFDDVARSCMGSAASSSATTGKGVRSSSKDDLAESK